MTVPLNRRACARHATCLHFDIIGDENKDSSAANNKKIGSQIYIRIYYYFKNTVATSGYDFGLYIGSHKIFVYTVHVQYICSSKVTHSVNCLFYYVNLLYNIYDSIIYLSYFLEYVTTSHLQ